MAKCKAYLQIPSLIDLSVEDVSGTSTDTILVVAQYLGRAVNETSVAVKRPWSVLQDANSSPPAEYCIEQARPRA
jgi:hypothetical protein